ncbi:MAG: hypothetical protein Q8P83_01080 [bacterium]|nr:hypothetical protein [bacterium]
MYNRYKFQPKKPVRSFRDLEVYQKTMECSVIIIRDIRPKLTKLKYDFLENMINCAMSVPLYIGESHSLRFSDFKLAVTTLEKAMQGCNKMIVYLEQMVGVYGVKLDQTLIEDLMHRYMDTRGKMWRLEKSWKKYRDETPQSRY